MSAEGRAPRIKNRAPAPLQITAEQLLREAQERQIAPKRKTPRLRIESYEELEDYRARKRTEFEDAVRRLRGNVCTFGYLLERWLLGLNMPHGKLRRVKWRDVGRCLSELWMWTPIMCRFGCGTLNKN